MFDWGAKTWKDVVSSHFWVYWVITVPLTAIVLFIWWVAFGRKRDKGEPERGKTEPQKSAPQMRAGKGNGKEKDTFSPVATRGASAPNPRTAVAATVSTGAVQREDEIKSVRSATGLKSVELLKPRGSLEKVKRDPSVEIEDACEEDSTPVLEDVRKRGVLPSLVNFAQSFMKKSSRRKQQRTDVEK
jgi:hypothetical protein